MNKSFYTSEERLKAEGWRFQFLGEALRALGYDKLQKIGDLPATLLKGSVWTNSFALVYHQEGVFWDPPGEPKRSKLLGKLLECLVYINGGFRYKKGRYQLSEEESSMIGPSIYSGFIYTYPPGTYELEEKFYPQINWESRVKARQNLPKDVYPLFFFGDNLVTWLYETSSERWEDKRLISFKIAVVICTDTYDGINLIFHGKESFDLPEPLIHTLKKVFMEPQKLIASLIESYLLRKSPEEAQILREKAWQRLKEKGLFVDGEIRGTLSDIRKAIKTAIRKSPKKRASKGPKTCFACGKSFNKRGRLCPTCYVKRWFALTLIENLQREGLIEDFLNNSLTEDQKRYIAKKTRPAGSRYSFNYIEKCLREMIEINRTQNWPDKKFQAKIEEVFRSV